MNLHGNSLPINGTDEPTLAELLGEDDPPTITNADFFSAVFHTMDEGATAWGTCFPTPPDAAKPGVWGGSKIDQRKLARARGYKDGDHNAFYCVSTFKPGANGKERRSKSNFNATHVIVLDDIGDGPSAKILMDKVKLPPSFMIETSPGNCQVGYILAAPEHDADYVNRVVDALVEQGLASPTDPGMKGLTRYVRFPVGTNNKTKYDPPHQHVLKEWHPERRYTLPDIIDAYGLTLAPPAPGRTFNHVAIDAERDPYLKVLDEKGLVLTGELRGDDNHIIDIICPFHDEHGDRKDEGAAYFIGGGFKCFHGHCIERTFKDIKEKLASDYGVDTDRLDREMHVARQANNTEALRLLSQQIGTPSEPWSAEGDEALKHVGGIPRELLTPPGLAGQIAEYHNYRSHRVAPIYGLATALASMSALSAGKYALAMPAGPASTNLFIMGLGGTGSGKEGLRSVVKDILKAADDTEAETSAASDIGLLRRLAKKRNAIWIPDEFGRTLRSAGNPSGGHQYALITLVMKIFGLAFSSTEPRDYADAKNNIPPIENPYLSVLATATANSVTGAMTSEEVVGGTLNRFIIIPNTDRAPPFRDGTPEVMTEAMETTIRGLSLDGIFSPKIGEDKFIPITPTGDAVEALIAYRGEADAKRADAGAAEAHLWARSYENALRVAGCIAIGDSPPDKPILSLKNAEWAIRFMRWSTQQAIGLLAHIADSDTERDAQSIVAFVKECVSRPVKGKHHDLNKNGWVPQSQITRKFQRIKNWARKQLIEDCVEGGYLEFKEFTQGENSKVKTSAFRPLMDE